MQPVSHLLVATTALGLALATFVPRQVQQPFGAEQQAYLPASQLPTFASSGIPPLLAHVAAKKETYEGASVIRVQAEHADRMPELMAIAASYELDVWSTGTTHADIFIPSPRATSSLRRPPPRNGYAHLFFDAGFRFRSFAHDVASLVANSSAEAEPYTSAAIAPDDDAGGRGSIPLNDPFHAGYRSLEEQSAFLADLARVYPWLATVVDLGQTPEGRPLTGIRIGQAPTEEGRRKKEIVYLSGQHAREWIGPSTALYWAHWLLENAKLAAVRPLLRNLDLTILPNLNGDGYEYSRTSSRLWRKTRQVINEDLGCVGIDTNRNWGYEWSSGAKDGNPCSEDFPGEHAFQAREVELVAEYIKSQNTIGFVDLHSYGQLIMYPWAHTCSLVPDAEDLEEVLLGTTKALKHAGGREYKSGQACKLAFRAPGDVVDWTYGQQDIKWSFSMELPDTGTWGFLLPAAQIRSVASETVEGLLYLAHFILQKEGGLRRI